MERSSDTFCPENNKQREWGGSRNDTGSHRLYGESGDRQDNTYRQNKRCAKFQSERHLTFQDGMQTDNCFIFHISINILFLLCVYVCMSAKCTQLPAEARRHQHHSSCNWSCRPLGVIVWVMGTKPRSSEHLSIPGWLLSIGSKGRVTEASL